MSIRDALSTTNKQALRVDPITRSDAYGFAFICLLDDKAVAVLTTEELSPLDDLSHDVLEVALQNAAHEDDWLQQHEAVVTLRQIVVHHPSLLGPPHITRLIPVLVAASDSLRSALSKNALLGLAESLKFLSTEQLRRFLAPLSTKRSASSDSGALLDVLLRRATCEKRFLRDAAVFAVEQAITYQATPELLASAALYADNKSAKVVALASRILAQGLLRLKTTSHSSLQPIVEDRLLLATLCQALASFRVGKDSIARQESLACFCALGELLGKTQLEATLQSALPDQPHDVAAIMGDVFAASQPRSQGGRRGSLRDRVLAGQQER
ncbi:hypothetical protein P43SY_009997 [Pythium insidiosum]|uniref:Uncharacterized protein n=1 Tax=Pythium insidiosum TaxID=114742 RepID=A0AAD5M858_PYTIN|nr:hypothetical protein P43SY_009997 [Pythium insidiosum]